MQGWKNQYGCRVSEESYVGRENLCEQGDVMLSVFEVTGSCGVSHRIICI